MSFLIHENKHWPLALTIAKGELTLNQHMESLGSWDTWFSNGQPFHAIRFFEDEASLLTASGAAQATQTWMAAGADIQFRHLLNSMLIVVPPQQYLRMKKMSVRKAFGIPGGLFQSLDDAFFWLENPPKHISAPELSQNWKHEIRETLEIYVQSSEDLSEYS